MRTPTTRRVGVEEELLLTDAATGELRPLAREVLAACEPVRGSAPGAHLKPEFFLAQVEAASSPQEALDVVRDELVDARARLADAAPLTWLTGPAD
ncbi:glutamate-cysteine ligase family protein [Nocardioides hankookensis]